MENGLHIVNAINPARPGAPAPTATASLGLAVVLAGAWTAAASELPLLGRQGLCLDRPPSTAPATAVMTGTELQQLVRLSETRFVVLLRERQMRVDRWADRARIEKERRAGGTSSATLEFVEEQWTLAIVDGAGKVRKRSADYRRDTPAAAMALVSGGEQRWARPILLAMEESPTCSYAVVTRSPARIVCFDVELAASDPVELPVEFVSGAGLQREGNAFTLWLFGKPPRSGGKTQGNENPESPVALRLPLGQRSLAPVPIHGSVLRAAVQAQAKDREGQRLAVDDDTLDLVPFSDGAQQSPLRVLVRAAGERVGAPNRLAWLFFRAFLGEEGLSALEPLPLWIEEGEGEAVIDARQAVVTLPVGSLLFDVEPFTVAGNRIGLYAHFLLPEASSPAGSGNPKSWIAFQFVALFSGRSLHRVILLNEDLLHDPKLTGPVDTRTHWLLPVLYMGRPGGAQELAFHAFSFAKDKRGPSLPCAAILSLP